MTARILLIEDDARLAAILQKLLTREGYAVDHVARGDEGLAQSQCQPYDVILTDLKLPGLDGLSLISQLHAAKPRLPIIMMTAHGTTETAIEATKLGAFEYLLKPCEPEELLDLIASAVAHSQRMTIPVELGEAREARFALVGNSRAMQEVYKQIGRVAATPVTVLIRGATGTGKELVARALYQHSDRADKPFIAVNCAAIPETLLESELFGHERGAFTGAQTRRIGRFEQAHGGTIFLDEIGDLSPGTQAKLLRVLQERCIQRLGGDETIHVNVRVLAATHQDLEKAIAEREFREDLFYRLSVVTLRLPALRDRAEDIPDLVRFFMQRHATDLAIRDPSIQPEAIAWLQRQPWPGNVRQLENVLRQAMLLARPFAVGLDHVQQVLARNAQALDIRHLTIAGYITELLDRAQRGEVEDAFHRLIADIEPELYSQAIRLAQGNQAKAARWLGVTRLKMHDKLTEFGLLPQRNPPPPGTA
ncbi:sigma-54 dependent transcriptional regulator [Fontisphaera persica]|uniref:sigma-54-dependent transcriptional regulator n=1 Tax=Fontisphaera persica TaxID=2974023 RepID=UPI0024C0ADFB|nr:sigma-54 dependent transcriptional regulator [Fontisphaera persica]WCJ57852.1 sigma-54 dependent transcriptional regulator [Fontisphaera persica]